MTYWSDGNMAYDPPFAQPENQMRRAASVADSLVDRLLKLVTSMAVRPPTLSFILSATIRVQSVGEDQPQWLLSERKAFVDGLFADPTADAEHPRLHKWFNQAWIVRDVENADEEYEIYSVNYRHEFKVNDWGILAVPPPPPLPPPLSPYALQERVPIAGSLAEQIRQRYKPEAEADEESIISQYERRAHEQLVRGKQYFAAQKQEHSAS